MWSLLVYLHSSWNSAENLPRRKASKKTCSFSDALSSPVRRNPGEIRGNFPVVGKHANPPLSDFPGENFRNPSAGKCDNLAGAYPKLKSSSDERTVWQALVLWRVSCEFAITVLQFLVLGCGCILAMNVAVFWWVFRRFFKRILVNGRIVVIVKFSHFKFDVL